MHFYDAGKTSQEIIHAPPSSHQKCIACICTGSTNYSFINAQNKAQEFSYFCIVENEEEKPKPYNTSIDPDKVAEQPGLLPYAHHVGSAQIKPIDKGRTRSRALMAMEEQTHAQLKQIQEQIELLAQQAKAIQKRVEVSNWIYAADASFQPLVGHVYHLYEKKDNGHVLSMVGPNEWGKTMPYADYIAAVRLMADHTWEVLAES